MSDAALVALLAVPAYLLGTFPTALLVARAGGHDVLVEGSGNPGASNVARLMGWRAGILVMAGDLAKGAIAAGVGLAVAGRGAAYVLGILAVLGHTYPVTRRFKGGKGVATAGGMLAVLHPLLVLILAVVWFLVARVLRLASVGSMLVAVLFPVGVALEWPGRVGDRARRRPSVPWSSSAICPICAGSWRDASSRRRGVTPPIPGSIDPSGVPTTGSPLVTVDPVRSPR